MSYPTGQDWAAYQDYEPSTKGLSFVFIKATQGTSYINPKMGRQAKHAREAGLVLGFYHFLVTGNIKAQAEYFVNKCASVAGDMLVVDWETDPVTKKRATSDEKDAFIKEVLRLRPTHKVGLYCNTSFWKNLDTHSYCGDFLWIADPSSPDGKPNIQHAWTFQQTGVKTIDQDIANFKSVAALRTWANSKAVTAKPSDIKPRPQYQPFPGTAWFTMGRKSPIVEAMHERLVAEGCNTYRTNTNRDIIGSGDVTSYEKWQRKCGFTGKAATWPPGKTTWDKLKVPNVKDK